MRPMAKILVVDDEPSLVATLDYNLRREGYEVVIARDGEAALEQARRTAPDLILLDVMLPKIDGIEVCRTLRRSSMVPILMLTARDGEVDTVVGLEIGADDYMTKPFSMRELLARVKAQLRRSARPPPEPEEPRAVVEAPILLADLEINPSARSVRRAGRPVHLKPREFALLAFLARNPGRVFSRAHLLQQVWGEGFYGQTRTVDVHVRWLREKIEDDPRRPRLIETLRGVGYRFGG